MGTVTVMGCAGSKKAAAEAKGPTTAEKTDTVTGKVPHAQSPHTLEALYTVNKHKLGEGAYGVVKDGVAKEDGEHVKKGQHVAIKFIDKDKLQPEDKAALHDEIIINQAMHHPGIVEMYDYFEDKDQMVIIMEACKGGELFDRIIEKGHFSERMAAETMEEACSALMYMHANGICHRDLKPENLLYENDDEDAAIKLADFGLASIEEKHRVGHDVMSTQCGTPGYIAPEILQGKAYNHAVDMWAMGVIFYIMMSGLVPFPDDDDQDDLVKRGEYDFEDENWEDVSEGAKDLVRGLLTVDPKKRLTAKEVIDSDWIQKKSKHSRASLKHTNTTRLAETHAKLKAKQHLKAEITEVKAAIKLMHMLPFKAGGFKPK